MPIVGSWIGRAHAAAAWRQFEITYDVKVAEEGAATVWLPLPTDGAGYQQSGLVQWSGNAGQVEIVKTTVTAAPILVAKWREGQDKILQVQARFSTLDRAVDWRRPQGVAADPMIDVYLQPTAHMPLDGIVRKTAQRITKGHHSPMTKARAVYDWIVDNTFRDPKVRGCGEGNIVEMLETGNLSGKCADLNALFVGLTRAAGVPAREMFGVRVAESRQFKSLGRGGDISKAQHCRAEFYVAGWGWIPADPADVRKAVLEENLPLTDDRIKALREHLFGHWEMNWVGFNRAQDFTLPGGPQKTFLMYPNGQTAKGLRDELEPAAFGYKITSRELT